VFKIKGMKRKRKGDKEENLAENNLPGSFL